jgi:hypothetical protein
MAGGGPDGDAGDGSKGAVRKIVRLPPVYPEKPTIKEPDRTSLSGQILTLQPLAIYPCSPSSYGRLFRNET